jgi:hypothetical protein
MPPGNKINEGYKPKPAARVYKESSAYDAARYKTKEYQFYDLGWKRLESNEVKTRAELARSTNKPDFIFATDAKSLVVLDARRIFIKDERGEPRSEIENKGNSNIDAGRPKDLLKPQPSLNHRTAMDNIWLANHESPMVRLVSDGRVSPNNVLSLMLVKAYSEFRALPNGGAMFERFRRIVSLADAMNNDRTVVDRLGSEAMLKTVDGYAYKKEDVQLAQAMLLVVGREMAAAQRREEGPLYDGRTEALNFSALNDVINKAYTFSQLAGPLSKTSATNGNQEVSKDLADLQRGIDVGKTVFAKGEARAEGNAKSAVVEHGERVIGFENRATLSAPMATGAVLAKAMVGIESGKDGQMSLVFSNGFSGQVSGKTLNTIMVLLFGQAMLEGAPNMNIFGRIGNGQTLTLANAKVDLTKLFEGLNDLKDLRNSEAIRNILSKFNLLSKLESYYKMATSERVELLIEKLMAKVLDRLLEEMATAKDQLSNDRLKLLKKDIEKMRSDVEERENAAAKASSSSDADRSKREEITRRVEHVKKEGDESDGRNKKGSVGGSGGDEPPNEPPKEPENSDPVVIVYNGIDWGEEVSPGEPNTAFLDAQLRIKDLREALTDVIKGNLYVGLGIIGLTGTTDTVNKIEVEFNFRPGMMDERHLDEIVVQNLIKSVMVKLMRLDDYRLPHRYEITLKGQGSDVSYKIGRKDDEHKEIELEVISDFRPDMDRDAARAARTLINFLSDFPGYRATLKTNDIELLTKSAEYLGSLKDNGFDPEKSQFKETKFDREQTHEFLATLLADYAREPEERQIVDPTKWADTAALTFLVGEIHPIKEPYHEMVEVVMPQSVERPHRITEKEVSKVETASAAPVNRYAEELIQKTIEDYKRWTHSSQERHRNAAGVEINEQVRARNSRKILDSLRALYGKHSDKINIGLKKQLETIFSSEGIKI